MKREPWWRDAVEVVRLTLTATCGHRHTEGTVYLKTERVGSVTEIWSVCTRCRDSKTWTYRPGDAKPWRRQEID